MKAKLLELPPLPAVLKYVRETYQIMVKASRNMEITLDQALARAEMIHRDIAAIRDPFSRSEAIKSAFGDKVKGLETIAEVTEKMEKHMAKGTLMNYKHQVAGHRKAFEVELKKQKRQAEVKAAARRK